MRAFLWIGPALLALAACQDVPGRDPAMADRAATCERRLQDYDRAQLFFSSTQWDRNQTLSMQVQRAAQAARQAGCVTGTEITDQLAGLLPEAKAWPRGERGAPIERTWVQAGVVGGITAEVQARQFFSGLGFNVRSRGAPGLGRRIFIGPFATEGGLEDAMRLARDAGFIAPYVRRF